MENKYNFKLAPAYCLYNGVAIIEQHGSTIKFLIENYEDEILKGRLKRAFCNYLNFVIRQIDCEEIYRRIPEIEFEKGERNLIRNIVSKLYGISNEFDNKNEENRERENSIIENNREQKEAAAVLLLDSILFEAKSKNATDIHIEGTLIKFRINGLLEYYMDINQEKKTELIQRIKLLGGMNSLEKRRSQDGHFVYGDEKPIFIRVSSVSVVNNKYEKDESVVLRLLDTSRVPLCLSFLGFNQIQLEKIYEISQLKNGLVLACGPTCSGKSTTIASILVEIEKHSFGKLKIISLEDPPEYIIPGVSQLKVEKITGNSFENSLDFIFRQDPDVIMIGEIRDLVSAKTAIRAALTGHLVFATLHTASPGEAVLRLENLGIDRKVITSILKCVIMQQLSYIEGKPTLYADVAVPNYDFSWVVNNEMGTEELNDYYDHYTNYMESLSKFLKTLGKRKNQNYVDWRDYKNGKEIYKHIV